MAGISTLPRRRSSESQTVSGSCKVIYGGTPGGILWVNTATAAVDPAWIQTNKYQYFKNIHWDTIFISHWQHAYLFWFTPGFDWTASVYEFLSCSFLLAGMLLIDWSSSSSRRNVPEGVLGICWYVNLFRVIQGVKYWLAHPLHQIPHQWSPGARVLLK